MRELIELIRSVLRAMNPEDKAPTVAPTRACPPRIEGTEPTSTVGKEKS